MNTLVDTSRTSLVGQLVGAWQIASPIGAGGMGSVWKGRHQHTGRYAAIKVILAEQLGNEQIVRRFEREARVVVEHTNVAQVLDAGRLGDGRFYIAIEYLEGATLEAYCRSQGKLSPEQALHFGGQIAAGLLAMHRAGFIHRDVKPENVLVTGSAKQVAKLIDFGFAKPTDASRSQELMVGMTQQQVGAGTPSYMPPEQFIDFAGVDERADVYCLAMTLFRMVTGRTAFLEETVEGQAKARWQQQFDLPAILEREAPTLSSRSCEAILRGLAVTKEARFANERELLLAFADGVDGGRHQLYDTSDLEEHAAATDETVKHSERTMPARAIVGVPPPAVPPISAGPSIALGEPQRSPAARRRSAKLALIALGASAIVVTVAIVASQGSRKRSAATATTSTNMPTPAPNPESQSVTGAPARSPPVPPQPTTVSAAPVAAVSPTTPAPATATTPTPPPLPLPGSATQTTKAAANSDNSQPPSSLHQSPNHSAHSHKIVAAPRMTNTTDSHPVDLDHPMGPQ